MRRNRNRVRTESWIIEKVLKFAKQLSSFLWESLIPDLEKVWKTQIKSRSMVKSLDFFVESYKKRFKIGDFFPVVKYYSISAVTKTLNHRMKSFRILILSTLHSHIMRTSWFLRFLKSLLLTYMVFDNLESGKINYCFPKKFRILGPHICFARWNAGAIRLIQR